jgi:hypothetical protein
MAQDPFRMGRRCYLAIHARVGDSRGSELGDKAARGAALEAWSKPADRELFVAGWRLERASHATERRGSIPGFMPGFDALAKLLGWD